MKRWIAMLLTVFMITGMLPLNVFAGTQEEATIINDVELESDAVIADSEEQEIIDSEEEIITDEPGMATLSELRGKFPAGRYWNHAGNPGSSNSVNNQNGTTGTPCPKHGTIGTDSQTCNGFQPETSQLSWQCMGYAEKLGYDYSGSNPRVSGSVWSTSTDSSALDSLKAGDIVRYKNNNHSIFVTAVNGDTVTYTDCNSDGHCIIRWDQTISKSTLRSSFTHVRRGPGITPDPGPVQDTIIHIDSPTPGGTYSGTTGDNIEISGWIVSNKDVNHAFLEVAGVTQCGVSFENNPSDLVSAYPGYSYRKRFRGAIEMSKLVSNRSYEYFVAFTFADGSGQNSDRYSFNTGQISPTYQTGSIIHFDSPGEGRTYSGTAGTNNIEISGWIVSDKDINYAFVEVAGVTQCGISFENNPSDVIAAYPGYAYYKRFRGAIELSRLSSNSSYECFAAFTFADGSQKLSDRIAFRTGTISQPTPTSYTLTYSANGGSGAPSSQSGTGSMTISSTIPKKFGYTFLGWSKSSTGGTEYKPGNSITLTSNTTLYAVWGSPHTISSINTSYTPAITVAGQERYYTFTPDASATYRFESTGSDDTMIYLYNSSGTLLDSNDDGPNDRNFRLDYSMTAGTTYYLMMKYYSGSMTGNINLNVYRFYTVSYNANGGTGAPSSQNKLYGELLTVSSTVPTKTYTITYNANGGTCSTSSASKSCTFTGWNTSSSGTGTTYSKGASYSPNANATLYAQWTNPTYGSLPTPTKTGSTFEGWYTSATGGTKVTTSTTVTGNTTLYAHWNSPAAITASASSVTLDLPTDMTRTITLTAGGSIPSKYNFTREITGDCFTASWTGEWNGTSHDLTITGKKAGTGTLTVHLLDKTESETGVPVATVNIPITVYADIYFVSYSANGGSGAPSMQSKYYGEDLTLSSAVPTKSYTVTYNANGGSCSTTSASKSCTFTGWNTSSSGTGTSYSKGATYTVNAPVTLYAQWTNPTYGSLPTPTRSGYTFDGWYTSATGGTKVSTSTTVTGNITLYAHWTEIPKATYTISYNANGGTGAPASQTKTEGVSLTLSSTVPAKSYTVTYNANGGTCTPSTATKSCTFNGWNTSSYGTGTGYSAGGTYTANASATLYAQWTNPTYGSLPTPTPAIYASTFDGWYTSPSGGTKVSASTTVTGNITLYAHWTLSSVSLTYNANGGTGAPSKETYSTPAYVGISSTLPTRFGYTFLGWSTSASSTTAEYVPGSGNLITVDRDLTVYAVWEKAATVTQASAAAGIKAGITIGGQEKYYVITTEYAGTFTFESKGDGDTYGYLYSADGALLFSNDDGGDSRNFRISEALEGGKTYYLKVKYFSSSATGTFDLSVTWPVPVKELKITSQPKSVTAGVNATVSYYVTAEGENLTYEWQYSKNGGEKWLISGATGAATDSISFKVSASNAGNIYRCKITGNGGKSIYSDTVGVELIPGAVIIKNPQSAVAAIGEYATFSVTAENAASYQWQYSKDGAHWYNSGADGNKTDVLKVKGAQNSQGNRYRCVVTGIDGNKKKSLMAAMVVLQTAPKNSTAAVGQTATFSLKAEGIVSYQWQYSKDGGNTWYKSGATGADTDTVSFKVTSSNKSMIYRCKLTTEDGAYAFTKPVGF